MMAPNTTRRQQSNDFLNLGIELTEDFASPPPRKTEQKQTGEAFRERRKWKRFAVNGAVVLIEKPYFLPVLKPAYVKLGPIKDISVKGLAVHYVEKKKMALEKAAHLSVMFLHDKVIVDKVPFKIVNCFKTAELPNGKEVWNLCIAFERLLPMQRMQIEAFISEYGNEVEIRPPGKQAEAGK